MYIHRPDHQGRSLRQNLMQSWTFFASLPIPAVKTPRARSDASSSQNTRVQLILIIRRGAAEGGLGDGEVRFHTHLFQIGGCCSYDISKRDGVKSRRRISWKRGICHFFYLPISLLRLSLSVAKEKPIWRCKSNSGFESNPCQVIDAANP